jgi:hypothetical protein
MYKHKKINKKVSLKECCALSYLAWSSLCVKECSESSLPQLFTELTISLAAYIHHFSAITIIMEEKSI